MPITYSQQELRKKHLGSSDMAAILGFDRFRNAYDVWLEKTNAVEPKKENEAMYAGTVFEDGVLAFAEKKLGKLKKNQYRSAIGFPLGSHIDALAIVSNNEPVEAKTGGLFGPLIEVWGEEGTDEVPDRVIIQCHVHMICADKRVCHVAAFLGGRGFLMYRIEWDNEIANLIMDKSVEFWENYVERNAPPPNIIPSLVMAQRMRREPNKIIDIPDEIVLHWQNAKESLKRAQEIEDAAKAQLLAALGDAEGGKYIGGLLTYFAQSRTGIDIKRLRVEKPEIAEEYQQISTYRVLRTKKPSKKNF